MDPRAPNLCSKSELLIHFKFKQITSSMIQYLFGISRPNNMLQEFVQLPQHSLPFHFPLYLLEIHLFHHKNFYSRNTKKLYTSLAFFGRILVHRISYLFSLRSEISIRNALNFKPSEDSKCQSTYRRERSVAYYFKNKSKIDSSSFSN